MDRVAVGELVARQRHVWDLRLADSSAFGCDGLVEKAAKTSCRRRGSNSHFAPCSATVSVASAGGVSPPEALAGEDARRTRRRGRLRYYGTEGFLARNG